MNTHTTPRESCGSGRQKKGERKATEEGWGRSVGQKQMEEMESKHTRKDLPQNKTKKGRNETHKRGSETERGKRGREREVGRWGGGEVLKRSRLVSVKMRVI